MLVDHHTIKTYTYFQRVCLKGPATRNPSEAEIGERHFTSDETG